MIEKVSFAALECFFFLCDLESFYSIGRQLTTIAVGSCDDDANVMRQQLTP
jgi:hypothetical protein